jgi:small-conductance mechanosensitive channel
MFRRLFIAIYCFALVGLCIYCPLQSHAQTNNTDSSEQTKSGEQLKSVPGATPEAQTQSESKSQSESPSVPASPETVAKSQTESRPLPEQKTKAERVSEALEGVPLIVAGVEIVRFKGTISGFTPGQRVLAILDRLQELEESPGFTIESIATKETGYSTDIVAGKNTLFTLTDRDAKLVGNESRETLANKCADRLKTALLKEKDERSPKTLFMASVFTAIAFAVLMVALAVMSAIFPRIYREISHARGKYISSLKIQKAELLSEESLTDILIGLCRVVRAVATIILLVVFAEVTLSFYPSTRAISGQVTQKFIYPNIVIVLTAITSYIPNLLIIIVVVVGTYYLIGFTHFIFNEVGRGSITFSGFEQEWADPTYKIARFLIISFALVLIFPYLPGSGSPAFQQISIFLGVLISLGSSGAVSNVVAGVFLTYTGAFRLGDRVRIADTVGDVTERRLIYTRVRTIKDEFITIPNSLVLGSHIINYSASMQGNGLVLHTSVTIGYDVDWRTVERLLIEAAKATEHVRSEPPPFVLVTSLDDFVVSHQINAYTSTPHSMSQIYADLHKNILDKFNEAGVEIMSPRYTSLRNGNDVVIPSNYKSDNPPRKPFSFGSNT